MNKLEKLFQAIKAYVELGAISFKAYSSRGGRVALLASRFACMSTTHVIEHESPRPELEAKGGGACERFKGSKVLCNKHATVDAGLVGR